MKLKNRQVGFKDHSFAQFCKEILADMNLIISNIPFTPI